MTLSTTTNKATFEGTGTTGPFSFAFAFFDDADIQVYQVAAGVTTLLTLTTDYTVAGAGSGLGGSVTLTAPLAAGESLIVMRVMEMVQPTDLENQGAFFADTHEETFDRLVMYSQQLKEASDRSIKLPIGNETDTGNLAEKIVLLANDVESINTVAENIDNVNAVGENIEFVNTVAGNIADVVTVADENTMTVVNAVAENIEDINTVAANISDVNTVAENLADVTNFADVYQGAKASDPALRNDGTALQAGDLYFNTTISTMRVYDGAEWIASSMPPEFVTEDDLYLSDVTTANVSTEKHGFVPKAPNSTTQFLRGDGAWAALPGGSSSKSIVGVYSSINPDKVTCGSVIPLDATVPQDTEGTNIIGVTFTPANASNILLFTITINFTVATAGSYNAIAALFKNGVASALAAHILGKYSGTVTFFHRMVAGVTSQITFTVRVGPESSGTVYINGNSSITYFGGVNNTSITVMEVTP